MANHIYIDEVYKHDNEQYKYGLHVYDDYESVIFFNWDKTPDDDLDLLYDILDGDFPCPDEVLELMRFAEEYEKGITIRNTYYDWDEISDTYNRAIKNET